MISMDIEKEIESKYTELQMVSQQMKQMQKQIVLLNHQLLELTALMQSLSELKEVKEGNEIMISFGNGIFARAVIKDSKELLVNVGAGVVVKKDVDGTKQLVQQQAEEIKGVHEQMINEIKSMYEHASSLEDEINKLAKKLG